jgi:FixJ family two-component response regulator
MGSQREDSMSSMSIGTCAQPSIHIPVREIIIVDDNEEWRDCLAAILGLEGYAVTGFSDGRSFLDGAADRTPICVFLDVFMPGPSGLEVLERLVEIDYQAPIFLISARTDAPVVLEAIRNGVLGVIEKPFDPYSAVLRVRQAADLWARRSDAMPAPLSRESPFAAMKRLTPQECAMLAQIAGGVSNQEAAKELGISKRVAARCRLDLKEKFGVKSFAELVRIALNEIAKATQEFAVPRIVSDQPTRAPSRVVEFRSIDSTTTRRPPLVGAHRDRS